MQEYLLQHAPRVGFFQADAPAPREGRLPLPEGPGLGIVLDEARIDERAEWA